MPILMTSATVHFYILSCAVCPFIYFILILYSVAAILYVLISKYSTGTLPCLSLLTPPVNRNLQHPNLGGGWVRYTREQKKCHMRKIGTICVDRYLHICILSLFLLTIFLPSINLTDCQIFAVYLHIYTLSLYCLMIFPPSVNLTFHSDVNDCSLLCIHFPYIVNCLTV